MAEAAKVSIAKPTRAEPVANDRQRELEVVSPLSKELVIGFVGYAGSGCSEIAKKLQEFLETAGYTVHYVKLSDLIEKRAPSGSIPKEETGANKGKSKLARATALQNSGDEIRGLHGAHAVASLAIKQVRLLRGSAKHGTQRIAFILDSIKHDDEVHLLRKVYDKSFRLVAVHCERSKREHRLIGGIDTNAKYRGAPDKNVRVYMDRDERDEKNTHGQQVRRAFYLADYFLDNNQDTQDGLHYVAELQRFQHLLLGTDLVRPRMAEVGMFHAHASAWQSACLSRQVGAALQAADGKVIATGTNEVPKFGGGVYEEDGVPDNRCFVWEWSDGTLKFTGCHNSRRKNLLRTSIIDWISEVFTEKLAEAAHPKPALGEMDPADRARNESAVRIRKVLSESADLIEDMPGVKDLIEYSRAVHAEMNALINAARQGVSPVGNTLYCTTFPCHSCARHLVTAGISAVYYIEPYVKSLAHELHSDSIQTELPAGGEAKHMLILPYTGIGPRMYEDYFVKRGSLKDDKTGVYEPPKGGAPTYAVRLNELADVEEAAANLVTEGISEVA